MDLVTPDVGLLFWTFCSFAILYFLLKKFAWKPILGSVNDREDSIREALLAAENAKKENRFIDKYYNTWKPLRFLLF